MARTPNKGHAALRRGRYSTQGAEYFLTACTAGRKSGLTEPATATRLLTEALRLEEQAIWAVRTATVMPDHVHLLVNLGGAQSLPNAMRLWKGRSAAALRFAGLCWERGYFDHRLRVDDDRLLIFLYIFLNPYRAALICPEQPWTGYYCRPEDWVWFEQLTNSSCPFPE